MDEDLQSKSREELLVEIQKLRSAIREHRDSTGHDLCWYQPELWALLPEESNKKIEIPDWPQFMRGCIKYRHSLDEQCPQAKRISKEFQDK